MPMPMRGPRGGRGPQGKMMGTAKAKDFKGSIKSLFKYIGNYKFAILIVVIFAIASTVFNVVGPKILTEL